MKHSIDLKKCNFVSRALSDQFPPFLIKPSQNNSNILILHILINIIIKIYFSFF